ncbi:MAG: NTPase [Thermodesulfovibrionales bacterium]|nr:NTPase [Thermodesulfovibrionales bacterium]
MSKKILLTGAPGVGKTTIIKKIISQIDSGEGFYTEEIRKNNIRYGFRIITLNGEKGILAATDLKTPYKVGKYYVDVDLLDKIGVRAIENALFRDEISFIIIDEIGKMELFSQRFKSAVIASLNSPKILIATIMENSNQFADSIKRRADIKLLKVLPENRDQIPHEIIKDIVGYHRRSMH